MSHLTSASLGHYAPLSFFVIGRSRRSEVRGQNLGFWIADCGSGNRNPLEVWESEGQFTNV